MPVAAVEPTSVYDALQDVDKQLLALVAAHGDARDGDALPWSTLLDYADALAGDQDSALQLVQLLTPRRLSQRLSVLANQLIAAHLLRATEGGLRLTDGALAMRGAWNGQFKALVDDALLVVD